MPRIATPCFRLVLSCLLTTLFSSLGWANEPTATDPATMKVAEGFQVELLYTVPKEEQGSWVSMCVAPEGKLIVSDQYGKLYKVTPPAIGQSEGIKVEPIPVDLGEAQGLLWAFDSLYVMVNKGQKYDSGFYRVTDSNDDGQLDKVELLRKLDGGREHGPHAIMLHPDGESLVVVCGNNTKLTDIDSSRVPKLWDEDLLTPRIYGRGFMRDTLAPGGYIAKVDPDGKAWELISSGFRNQYDAAYNRDGELFTYDADMEWDFNTPWYRPTRICHVVSGGEFGWRNGSGKWPEFYEDSIPPVLNIGPGSPTGVAFGYGAKFPEKYENALFSCDWSYGKLYAVHLIPDGASYQAEAEEFITGTPLPLTDIVVNPADGAMYFAIGGRKTQSGLYRVTYTGEEKTFEPLADKETLAQAEKARAIRHKLEAFHGVQDEKGIDLALEYLGDSDRFLRHAARTVLEHQDPALWQEKALKLDGPMAKINAAIGIARAGDKKLADEVLKSLDSLQWKSLTRHEQINLARAYGLVFMRMQAPEGETKERMLARFHDRFPSRIGELDGLLCELLVYLESPKIAEQGVQLLENTPTQEQQIDIAKKLRLVKNGWNDDLRKRYLSWFTKAANYRGGASFGLFVEEIKNDAVANLTDQEKEKFASILDVKPEDAAAIQAATKRSFVKKWTVDELVGKVEKGLTGRDFDKGRQLFGEASCFSCHRFDYQGGAMGPDLTAAAGRFSPRDLLESVIEPSKQISDQYEAVKILTDDGRIVVGRIVNLSGDIYKVNTDMLDPNAITDVNVNHIEEMVSSDVSMMPEGLLDTFTEDEVLNLMAYLLSRANPDHEMFAKE